MTLYRLVSGRDPQDEVQLREMREFAPRYFNSEISPETEHLILVAIAPELQLRFQSLDDFINELETIRRPDSVVSSLPPFTFANGQKARNATDLARLLDTHEEESINYLFNGMFATWLLQNGFAAPAREAENVVKTYVNNPPVALELFRRALYPTGTSHVLPRLESEPASLNFGSLPSGAVTSARLRMRNVGPGLMWGDLGVPPKSRPGGQTALSAAVKAILQGGIGEDDSSLPGLTLPPVFQGNDEEIEVALDTTRVPVGAYSSHIVVQTDAGIHRIPVSYSVVPLELRAEPAELDFGAIQVGRKMQRQLAVVPLDDRGGTPRGTVYIGPSLIGTTAPDRFEGREGFWVVVDASSPAAVAKYYDGLLQLDTNGGRIRVPVRYRITLPPGALAALVGAGVVWGAAGSAMVRIAYIIVNPDYVSNWLLQSSPSGSTLMPPEIKGLGTLLAGALLGTYGMWIYSQQLKRIVPRERPRPFINADDSFLSSLPILGLFFGSFGGYLGAQLLHWTLWSLGDWLLYPFTSHFGGRFGMLARQNPLIMWAVAGACGGLVWGISKVIGATGRGAGRTIFIVVMAIVFFLLLLNASLVGNPVP